MENSITPINSIVGQLGIFIAEKRMCSPRSGNTVNNQWVYTFKNGSFFISYNSHIAIVVGDKTYISPKWDSSATTKKYTALYLGCAILDIYKRIKNGMYVFFE
jgi:hypothetical protein